MNIYVKNILIAIDRTGNVLLLGDPDETISARAGRIRNSYPYSWGVLATILDWIKPKHVENAIIHDEERAEYTASVESKYK